MHRLVYSYADHLRTESLKRRLSEVKQLYCNIPSILHFNYSTVALDQIGVTARQPLPKGIFFLPKGMHASMHTSLFQPCS